MFGSGRGAEIHWGCRANGERVEFGEKEESWECEGRNTECARVAEVVKPQAENPGLIMSLN